MDATRAAPSAKIAVERLNLYYGGFHALQDIQMAIQPRCVTAMIGPSGCGKSSLLRCLNRMNELVESARVTGRILLDGDDIMRPAYSLVTLRKQVGMVFQRPNPFPLSVYENIAFGLRIHSLARGPEIAAIVERSLRAVALWDELKDRLRRSALRLSLEQQQRLCIARLLAVQPEVLLMDEPCSALDPIATGKIEELMHALKARYTIVIVTHNMQQAARVSDVTGFLLMGELIEFDATERIFTTPKDSRTEAYITGRFG
ncbi:MAG: phosphate ABC transporter ATP-binding protein [Omnitrophica bacterium RIFCSPHIGHO2_02_FULL_63_14]|nr:MAG: phosphate ABC transporter ATP-binding protein [Omnitrophica bacterium RIFCSPHIGHO2_02_FULL_63_14]